MRRRTWLLVIAGALGVACVIYVAPMVALVVGMGKCDYDVKDQKISPDGQRKAAIVEVNCGATTDYASWVVATDAESKFRYRRDGVTAAPGRALRIAWDGRKLVIFHRATETPIPGPARGDPVEYRNF